MYDQTVRLAVDIMGSDAGATSCFKGLESFLHQYYYARGQHHSQHLEIKVFTTKEYEHLITSSAFASHLKAIVCEKYVLPTASPLEELRNDQTSLYHAIKEVAANKADAVISCGNTGVYVALLRYIMKLRPGSRRAAISKPFPTLTKVPAVLLDLGANAQNTAEDLLHLARLGAEYFSCLCPDIAEPRVGILNIGTEANKGNSLVQTAYGLFKDSDLNFQGFVEPVGIFKGQCHVIVTDGFTGNMVLKTIEGTGIFMQSYVKLLIQQQPLWRKALLAFSGRNLARELKDTLDPARYNGAIILGVNGIAIKSHGGASPVAFSNAVSVGYKLAEQKATLKFPSNTIIAS